ncbi:hypothetical protein [Streptomyces sp. NPDC002851]
MRIRTGIAATVAATAMVFGASSVSVAAEAPQNVVQQQPTSVAAGGGDGDGATGIGLNLLCGIGLLGQGACSN